MATLKFVMLLTLLIAFFAAAAVPLGTEFTYQGELKQLGVPADGEFDFEFELFDVEDLGTAVVKAVTREDVEVVDGRFSVILDFGIAPFSGDQLWLAIGVREGASTDPFVPLVPRQKLTATPYALHAEFVAMGAVGAPEVDSSSVQLRVSDSCPSGSSIRSIDVAGGVVCESEPDLTALQDAVAALNGYSLRSQLSYSGSRSLSTATVLHYTGLTSCDSIFTPPLLDPAVLPPSSLSPRMPPVTTNMIDDTVVPNVAVPESFTVVAYAQSGNGATLAYGCDDSRPAGQSGVETALSIALTDVPLSIAGSYPITTNLDFSSSFPRRASVNDPLRTGDHVDTIVGMFSDPDTYFVDTLLGIPEFAAGLTISEQEFTTEISAILSAARAQGNATWAANLAVVAGNVSDVLNAPRFEGEIVLVSEPDEMGALAEAQEHRYFATTYSNDLPCAPTTCAPSTKTLLEVTGDSTLDVSGIFAGQILSSAIDIDLHGVLIPLGLIAQGVTETEYMAVAGAVDTGSIDKFVVRIYFEWLVDYFNATHPPGEAIDCRGGGRRPVQMPGPRPGSR